MLLTVQFSRSISLSYNYSPGLQIFRTIRKIYKALYLSVLMYGTPAWQPWLAIKIAHFV